ncbi:MAG: 30S ribosomal protein S6 [Pseudomonadota bacterium]
MAYYECVFIARQDVTAAQVDGLTDDFTKIIEDNGGSVASKEYWGLRTLAHRIKKNRKGHYVLLNLDAPSDAIQEVERNMRISDDVVRYMTIRTEVLPTGPSVMMQNRGGRDDRGGRRPGRPPMDRPSGDRPSGDRAPGAPSETASANGSANASANASEGASE